MGRPLARLAADGVADHLRNDILDRRLAPGTVLRQEALARDFGVSRMPIRTALGRLAAEGLVDLQPHVGAVVAKLSAADAADIMAIRRALEPAALRLSVPYLSAEALAEARRFLSLMESAGHEEGSEAKAADLGTLNARFHRALLSGCPHQRMLQLIDAQLKRIDQYMRFGLLVAGHQAVSQDDHRALLGFVQDGAIDDAVQCLDRHIDGGDRVLMERLRRHAMV